MYMSDSSAAPAVINQPTQGKSVFSDIGIDRSEYGSQNSLRFRVLNHVESSQYDVALECFQKYFEQKSPYPDFKERTKRFVNHGMDLIHAIRAKRNFPGLTSLTRAKQQELREKLKEHFRELAMVLKKLEKIDRDLLINDARSTIYVVRAVWVSFVLLMVVAFFLELRTKIFTNVTSVAEENIGEFVEFIFKFF